jgi:hypothetical protein
VTSREHVERYSLSTQLLTERILLVGAQRKWQSTFEDMLLIQLPNASSERTSCHTADEGRTTDILISLHVTFTIII